MRNERPARFTSLSHEDLLGDYALGHKACRQARLNAPTWQEIAMAVRPYLRGLPPPGREAYARALLAEAEEVSSMTFLPAPHTHRPREEFQRALLTGAYEALKRGDHVAAIHRNPNGTYEVSDIRIPPIFPKKQDSADTMPASRPALRLVKDEHHPPVPEASTRGPETSSPRSRGRSRTGSRPRADRETAAPATG